MYCQPTSGFMTHVTCRLTAKNRDEVRNAALGNRVWATFYCLILYLLRRWNKAACVCLCVCRSYTFPTMQQIGEDLVHIIDQLQSVASCSLITPPIDVLNVQQIIINAFIMNKIKNVNSLPVTVDFNWLLLTDRDCITRMIFIDIDWCWHTFTHHRHQSSYIRLFRSWQTQLIQIIQVYK